MGARQDRQPDDVDVLLERRRRDHLGRLAEARVDDLEALVAEAAGEDLGAAVVAVEAGLGDEHLDRAVGHGPIVPRRVIRPRPTRRRTRWLPLPFGRREPEATAGDRIRRRRHPEGRRRRRPRGAGAGPQATARPNARDASHTANRASAPMITAPIAISGFAPVAVEQRPGGVRGMGQRVQGREELQPVRRERQRQQDPRQEEQRQGDPVDDGREGVLALERRAPRCTTAARTRARSARAGRSSPRAPPRSIRSPNGIATTIIRIAWQTRITTSRSDRPKSIAIRLIGVTRIRSTTPERSSAISPNPTNAPPKTAIWMSRPGMNQLKAFSPTPAALTEASRSGPEQDEVEDRLHQAEDDPDRLAEGQDQRSAEDQPGVAEGASSRSPFRSGREA